MAEAERLIRDAMLSIHQAHQALLDEALTRPDLTTGTSRDVPTTNSEEVRIQQPSTYSTRQRLFNALDELDKAPTTLPP